MPASQPSIRRPMASGTPKCKQIFTHLPSNPHPQIACSPTVFSATSIHVHKFSEQPATAQSNSSISDLIGISPRGEGVSGMASGGQPAGHFFLRVRLHFLETSKRRREQQVQLHPKYAPDGRRGKVRLKAGRRWEKWWKIVLKLQPGQGSKR